MNKLKVKGVCLMITHIFKSETEEERSKNVTQILIDLEIRQQKREQEELEYLLTTTV
jgi:hypothetical protein